MAFSPITSWQMEGEKVDVVTDFLFLSSKNHCRHEFRRRLLLGRKAMTHLDSVLKSREITLLTKVCIVKAMVFSVVKYDSERWTVKKSECQRIPEGILKQGTPDSSLDIKDIKPVNLKENQP